MFNLGEENLRGGYVFGKHPRKGVHILKATCRVKDSRLREIECGLGKGKIGDRHPNHYKIGKTGGNITPYVWFAVW